MLLGPAHHTNLNQLPVCAIDSLLERFRLLSSGPAERKGDRPAVGARFLEAARNRFCVGYVGIEKCDEKLVAAHSHHRLFGANVPHQKPAHLYENRVAGSVPVRVVVLLEVIDVDVDASPSILGRPFRSE